MEKPDHLGAVYHGDTERDSSPTSKNFVPDLAEAARFLRLLDPDAAKFLFASFADKGNAKQAPWHRLGSLGDVAAALGKRQVAGAGVFITINGMRGASRANSEVTRIRAVFADLDAGPEPTKPWPIDPSIVVRSSVTPHEKRHVYFLVDPSDPLTLDDFASIQATIVRDYGSDKAARDLARTLRLPGTWNIKHLAAGAKPHLVTIVGGSGRRYTRDELLAAFPPAQKRAKPAPRPYQPSPETGKAGGLDARLLDALGHIDPAPYDQWILVGAALHAETGGGGDGYIAWRDWSARADSFSEAACLSRWSTFARTSGPRAGAGSIIHLAREAGWRPQARRKALRNPLLVQHDAEPTYPAPTLSVDEARLHLRETIEGFGRRVAEHWRAPSETPPVLALPITVGLGKSTAARAMIADLIKSGALGGQTVVYAVPTHRLGEEQISAFSALGIRAAAWRGRDSDDPDVPGEKMCRDLDAVSDAIAAGQTVQSSACRSEHAGQILSCPHYETCAFQKQRAAVADADVVVTAHTSLFFEKPGEIGSAGVGILVADESFWQSALVGVDASVHLHLDGIDPERALGLRCFDRKGAENHASTADLRAARARLMKVISQTRSGPISIEALEAAGLTAADCRAARKLEFDRFRDCGLRPGMSPAERRKKIADARPASGAPASPIHRSAMLWSILADALDHGHDAAGASIETRPSDDGAGDTRVVAMRYRRAIRDGWIKGVPVLHLDATMAERLVAPFLPMAEFAPPVAARLPDSVRVRQVLKAPVTAHKLALSTRSREREKNTADGHVRRLAAYIAIRARAFAPGLVLVIAQKGAEARLREAGLPDNVELAHFGAVAGIDQWRDVRLLIIVGRTAPAPHAVEMIGVALNGRPVEPVCGRWHDKIERRIAMPRGRTVPVAGDAHPDEIAEAARWSICEGELIQALGRARAVNRTTKAPLQIDILCDVVLPIEVHEAAEWPDVEPTLLDMAALSGAVLTSAVDLAAAFPDIFDGPRSAQRLMDEAAAIGSRAAISDRFAYKEHYIGETVTNPEVWTNKAPTRVTYRPAGRGQQSRFGRFDLRLVPDPRAWLTERLGTLAFFEVEGAPPAQAVDSDRCAAALRLCGVLPLSGHEAATLVPTVWTSRGTAERDLTGIDRAALAGEFGVITEAVYTREPGEGGRARERRALVAARPEEAQAVLEAVTGPLRAFEIVEVVGDPNETCHADQQVVPPAAPTPADIKAQAAARLGRRVREFIEAVTAPARQVSRAASVVDSLIEQAVEQARAVGGSPSARNLLARLAGAHIERRDNLASFREAVAVAAAAVAPPDP